MSALKNMSFFQLIRSLKKKYGDDFIRSKKIKLHCSDEIGFPTNDFSIEYSNNTPSIINVNFMGLFGVDGCLPSYFNELLHEPAANTQPLKIFLDIFHHRIYELFFKAWQSQQPDINLELGDNGWLDFMDKLLPRLEVNHRSLELAPYYIGHKRTLGALYNILKIQVPNTPLIINTMQPSWRTLTSDNYLGKTDFILGENVLLGGRYLSGSQQLSVQFGPVSHDKYLKIKKEEPQLVALLSQYLEIFQTFALSVLIFYQAAPLCLGKKKLFLGGEHFLGESTFYLKKKI